MDYWFTSDNHFGHVNIIKYCNRPFKNVEEMDNVMINNWNSLVKNDDIVFHLGDFGFLLKNVDKIKAKLNGTIIHIKGNHDKSNITKIEQIKINIGGYTWTLIHNSDNIKDKHVLCGHVHELWKVKKKGHYIKINVGVDVWDFKPIKIESILKLIQTTK